MPIQKTDFKLYHQDQMMTIPPALDELMLKSFLFAR